MPSYTQVYKGISRGFLGMGVYGFTRGFRSEHYYSDKSKRNMLFSERVMEGLINSVFYVMPVWNIYSIFCLFNRIEISSRGLNKDVYIHYYKEPLSGYCLDTV